MLDIGLPGIDGFEVARRLRRFLPTASVPIVAVSAQALHGYRDAAAKAGCDEALVKPCLPKNLLDALNRVLAGQP